MSSEIQELRKALVNTSPDGSYSSGALRTENTNEVQIGWAVQLPVAAEECGVSAPEPPAHDASSAVASESASPRPYRIVGLFTLTAGQVKEHFRAYFARCHRYLPLELKSRDPDDVYLNSPLLFWAICAAASSWKLQSQLEVEIKTLVATTLHSKVRAIETVQALLVLCMWPFRVSKLHEDPSHFYIGLATQMCLQLGLHRPSQPHSHLVDRPEYQSMIADAHVKTTTWLACFVVNQMQSSYLGVPPSILVDLNLANSFDNPKVDKTLSQLCRIYHLLSQSCLAISANGPTPSGMLAPDARLLMMKLCDEHLSTLHAQYLQDMNDIVQVSFLYSRLQTCSFALLDDMPVTDELVQIINSAEETACELIELCYGMNLAVAPYIIRQVMCYGAFVLVRIMRLQHSTQREVLEDNIERVCQAMSTTASADDGITRKLCPILRALPYVEDKSHTSPIMSRMAASIVYDSIRIYWNNSDARRPSREPLTFDFDGYDWNTLLL
ncbi:Regulatory protein leu3 [Exophiala xenobiotica]|uniref:Regulatory protein leu3 n=1 Tax=Lithohypha guttulata TaxID=1690604 RepID=A0ABR0KF26_9EURO|nr:Regulatory protein leu3 [Lithohypha guttulata]KAK5322244.1 Regulatory protein leu3 [Exophiala xenobiotica]